MSLLVSNSNCLYLFGTINARYKLRQNLDWKGTLDVKMPLEYLECVCDTRPQCEPCEDNCKNTPDNLCSPPDNKYECLNPKNIVNLKTDFCNQDQLCKFIEQIKCFLALSHALLCNMIV